MKTKIFTIVIAIAALFPASAKAQNTCGDPGGCSIVSYSAFQNNVGIVQFGNTTGKVFLKKKRTLCNTPNCSQLFTMTAALAAPKQETSTGSATSATIPARQILIGVQIREINSDQTKLLGINLDDFLADVPAENLPSKAKLNSGFPDFKGAGNNGFMHIAPAPGNKVKFIHQIFQTFNEKLAKPAPLGTTTTALTSGTVDRDLGLAISAEVTDDLNVRLAIQPITATRKKAGAPSIFNIPPVDPTSTTERISSTAVTPLLTDLPVLGHLFAHKKLRHDSTNNVDLAIFIAPVLISNGLQNAGTPQTVTLGPALQLTQFQPTTNGSIEFFQTLAIDPKARFLVYSEYNKKCKKNVLKYMRLNIPDLFASTDQTQRQRLARPKVLLGCSSLKDSTTGVYGIDVLNLN